MKTQIFFFLAASVFLAVFAASVEAKDSPAGPVVIHATNISSVPSVHYVVDAVDCLTEAYAVYADDVNRSKLYSELFEDKHNETKWNVIVGYTAFQIKSQWYVETSVTNGKKDDKSKEVKYLIFSSQAGPGLTLTSN